MMSLFPLMSLVESAEVVKNSSQQRRLFTGRVHERPSGLHTAPGALRTAYTMALLAPSLNCLQSAISGDRRDIFNSSYSWLLFSLCCRVRKFIIKLLLVQQDM